MCLVNKSQCNGEKKVLDSDKRFQTINAELFCQNKSFSNSFSAGALKLDSKESRKESNKNLKHRNPERSYAIRRIFISLPIN